MKFVNGDPSVSVAIRDASSGARVRTLSAEDDRTFIVATIKLLLASAGELHAPLRDRVLIDATPGRHSAAARGESV